MLTYTIACIGMTQIIIYGSIFDRIRPNLWSPPLCWDVIRQLCVTLEACLLTITGSI